MTMLLRLVLFISALAVASPALAQRQRVPPPESNGGPPPSGQTTSSGQSAPAGDGGAQPRQAVPRDEARGNPRIERAERGEPQRTPPAAVPRSEPRVITPLPAPVAVPPPVAAGPSPVATPEASAQAVPRGSRSRGDNPPTGNAVPRPEGRRDGRNDPRVYPAPRTYNNYYYYYPRRNYPYGYGSFGLGYFYYDPYSWYPGSYSYDPYYPGRAGYYSGYRYAIGSLRLDVRPRDAEVYVDGYYAGRVDDFDGAFQSLDLEEGPYRIEVVLPGFETLEFNIRIQPGRKITYRGSLRRLP